MLRFKIWKVVHWSFLSIPQKLQNNVGKISNAALHALQKNPKDTVEAGTASRRVSAMVLAYLELVHHSDMLFFQTECYLVQNVFYNLAQVYSLFFKPSLLIVPFDAYIVRQYEYFPLCLLKKLAL